MSASGLERIDTSEVRRQLWPVSFPDVSVFALLDGARDRRIEPMVRDSNLEFDCLYAGDLTRRLRAAAPYIVHLTPQSEITEVLLEEAWGESWGVFVVNWRETPLSQMRRHFREFLRAKDEDGKIFAFRFYDPRVLRVYLPTCTTDEARTFFGPTDLFLMEAESPERLLVYSVEARGVRRVDVSLI